MREHLGEDHPTTILVATNAAGDLFDLDHLQVAHDLDTNTAARSERVLGPDHLTTLACRANLAQDLCAPDREQEGTALRVDVVAKTVTRFGSAHPAVREFSDPELRANGDIDPMPL